MRKLVVGMVGVLLFFLGAVFAYQPSSGDVQEVGELKQTLSSLTESDNAVLWSFYEQARDIYGYIKDEKTEYILQQLRDYLLSKFNTRKEAAKQESESLKKELLLEYGAALVSGEALSENCYGWYNTLDNLSYAYDFPTALTIAVWYRESSCGYYLPKNGDGPFQIVSKDYGNGEITKEIFETTIKDFLEFAWNKINWYNSKNPDTPIVLGYRYFTYKDLYKFAGLYNGLSGGTVYGDIAPANEKYFLEKMPGEYENGKKNGLFLQFLKVLEWELNQ